jgi:hypothetical protein
MAVFRESARVRMDNFTRAYIEAAIWSSDDEHAEALDRNYDIEDFAPETLAKIVKDCEQFQSDNRELIDSADYQTCYPRDEMAGHDFWLTRNHHGAGFWDRGLGEIGQKLTKAAHAFGECDIYVGDDGKLYLS